MNTAKKLKHIALNVNYKEWFSALLWAAAIALIFRTLAFEPFRIPSGSMIPTLMVGDFLFTEKYKYGYSKYSLPFGIPIFEGRLWFSQPQRGDIIVFKGVDDPHTYYIKRLIGLPGDSIQMKNNVLYINEQPIDRKYIGEFVRVGAMGEHIEYSKYLESLPNGIEYVTLDANIDEHRSFPNNTVKYTVPDRHYFFMGDNRDNSVDSRFLNSMGYVPEDRLVGKAVFLFWSSDLSLIDLITKGETGRAFHFIN
jgi:signal peptidase I